MEERKALGADLVIPLLALAFAAYFFTSIAGLEWEAKANGVIVGVLMVTLIGMQLMRIGVALARGRATFGFEPLLSPPEALRKRLGMLAVAVALIFAMRWTGLAIGLFLALSAGFAIMGVRGPARILLTALAVTAAAEALFVVALDASLPSGPVEHLIARLRS